MSWHPFRRRWPRRCTQCGRRLVRVQALIHRDEYNAQTGKRKWVWYWGCEEGFFGYNRSYLDGRPYHDAERIPTSPVRRRLEAA